MAFVQKKGTVVSRGVCIMRENKRIVLVAAIGVSPAVLTETVWAMAHESKPLIPDTITVVTTAAGKKAIEEKLLSGRPSMWDELLRALEVEKIEVPDTLRFGSASIVVVPDENGNEAHDLRSSTDNLCAADRMLEVLRSYTEDPQTVVYASIAGGRKTMGALMLMCMSLLGRDEDHATHVLTKPDVLGMVSTKDGSEFYFPRKGHTYEYAAKKKRGSIAGKKVCIELFDVPFVRMRGWYQEKFKSVPPSYRALVAQVQEVSPPAVVYPKIEIDAWNGWVKVDGKIVEMAVTSFATLILLAVGCKKLNARLLDLHSVSGTGVSQCDWLATFQAGERFDNHSTIDAMYKSMHALRTTLKSAGFVTAESLVPKRKAPQTFPLSRIKWHNRDRLVKVCGSLLQSEEEKEYDHDEV